MSDSNTTPVKKDAMGYDAITTYTINDAITTYTINDGLGINALPDSEKYKKGIRENTTGRARTLGIWMSCPDCGFNRKFQEFIPNDYSIELSEDIERKECPDPDCKSKNFSVFMAEKDTVFHPSPTPKRQGKVSSPNNRRQMFLWFKASGSKQGCDKEEWYFRPGTTWTPKKHNQKCPDCDKEYHIDWTVEERTYL